MVINFRKVLEKIVSIFLDVLLILFGFILLIFIYNNFQTKILGNDYSNLFGFSTFEVQTGSMEGEKKDSISIGDWIIVRYTNNVKPGDIITYQKDGNFVTHRVVAEYNGTYITMGDANNTKDEPVSREQVVGKVVKILPNFGIIRKTILNPAVLISLIITFYLFGYALRSIKNDKKELNNKELTKKIDDFVNGVLDKLLLKNKKSKKEFKKNSSVKDKYEFFETEIDVSRNDEKELVEDDIDTDVDDTDESVELENDDDDEEIVLPEIDMDKTMYFRMLSVNKSDIDSLGVNPETDELGFNISNLSDEELDVVNENEVQKCNDLINTKKKKFKNIIEKVMYIKKNELNSILNVLNRKEKLKTNESSIIDELINTYIRSKYYNFDSSRKSVIVRINDALKESGNYLINTYKGKDKFYSDKVNKYVKYLMLVNELDKIDKLFDTIPTRRENYNNKLLVAFKSELSSSLELKDMVNGIIKIKKVHDTVINESISKLMSNTFNLEIQEIDKKKLFSAKLVHNINFSKVYSDFIIDKTYSEGIIAEDKIIILVTLLLAKIIKEIVNDDIKNKYLIHLPESIYKKSNKLDKILSILDDDIAKNSIILFNDYDEIINNKKIIKLLRKNDYHLAIRFSRDSVIKEKDASYISLAEYLFVDSKVIKEISLLDYITEDDKANIIKEDIYNKVIN